MVCHVSQDAIDLVHGHFIASVSQDMTTQPQKGSLEALAVKGNSKSFLESNLVFLVSIDLMTCFCIAVSSCSSFPGLVWLSFLNHVSEARCV